MNILILSIGKRKYLIDHFKEHLEKNDHVYASDASKYAPALRFADKYFIIPKANSRNYFNQLIKISKKNKVNIVLSINDVELPYLAKIKKELINNKIIPIISDEKIIDVCFDKYLTYQYLHKNGFNVPLTYISKDNRKLMNDIKTRKIKFPIIAKPRKGSRSQGIFKIYDLKTLKFEINKDQKSNIKENEKYIFQEFIESDQYSLHILNDLSGNTVSVVGMVNIVRHMDGETFQIRSYKEKKLMELGLKLGKTIKHIGPLSVDIHKKDNKYTILELNPRISGCYSLSHYADKNYTKNFIKIMKNIPIKSNLFQFKENVIMVKNYDVSFFIE